MQEEILSSFSQSDYKRIASHYAGGSGFSQSAVCKRFIELSTKVLRELGTR